MITLHRPCYQAHTTVPKPNPAVAAPSTAA